MDPGKDTQDQIHDDALLGEQPVMAEGGTHDGEPEFEPEHEPEHVEVEHAAPLLDEGQSQPSEPTVAETQSKDDEGNENADANVEMETPIVKKRTSKMTTKAYLEKLDKLQRERKSKFNKATNLQKTILELMHEDESKQNVQCEFMKYINIISEATGAQDALLPILPPEEKNKHKCLM